jgi:hypothetical protein
MDAFYCGTNMLQFHIIQIPTSSKDCQGNTYNKNGHNKCELWETLICAYSARKRAKNNMFKDIRKRKQGGFQAWIDQDFE